MKRWLARAIYLPTLGYNYLLGRVLGTRHWWDEVDQTLIIGARPFARDAASLQALGVTGVVNMCEECAGPKEAYERLGIEQLWLPTVDFNHPSEEFTERGADFIERHRQAGGRVYVHCKAGRARSATICLWWLVKYCGQTPQQAQATLLAARPHVNPAIYQRPVIQNLAAQRNAPSGPAADPSGV